MPSYHPRIQGSPDSRLQGLQTWNVFLLEWYTSIVEDNVPIQPPPTDNNNKLQYVLTPPRPLTLKDLKGRPLHIRLSRNCSQGTKQINGQYIRRQETLYPRTRFPPLYNEHLATKDLKSILFLIHFFCTTNAQLGVCMKWAKYHRWRILHAFCVLSHWILRVAFLLYIYIWASVVHLG